METSRLKEVPFKAVLERLETYHGITMDESDAVNIGLLAWDKIGNKETVAYRHVATPVNREILLPCNVDYVEAVSIDVGTCCAEGDLDSLINDLVQETPDEWVHELYPRGTFIPFNLISKNDRLYVTVDVEDYEVEVIYIGIRADKEGLPYLNEKEAEAITFFLAHNYHYKRFAAGVGTQISQNLIQMLYQQWDRLCADARVPYEFTQNEMDKILDAQQSWDRKAYGKSFKAIK